METIDLKWQNLFVNEAHEICENIVSKFSSGKTVQIIKIIKKVEE